MNLIKTYIMQSWSDSNGLRIFVKILSAVAIFALIAWVALSIIAHYRIDSAQVLFEKDLSQSVELSKDLEMPQIFTFRAKLRFANPLFRYQRNITHIDITQILWADSIDKSAISETKTTNDRFFDFSTAQNLNALKSAELGFAEYKSDFVPLLKTIIFYYILLIFAGFVLNALWRYNRAFVKYALIFIAFSLVILSFDGAKIKQIHLVPFGIIGLVAFGLCMLGAIKCKNAKVKLFLAYFCVVPLCLGIAEFWLFLQSDKNQSIIPHEILGYANAPLYSNRIVKEVDDKVIYDIVYSNDEYGNRITPNNNLDSKKCIAIYGGSFAYGAAVDSDKSLEAFLAKELPEYRLLNFGISATGAHTALARLEFKIDANILAQCEEFIAIYEAIPHHIYRAYGAHTGANYKLNANGIPEYWGTYTESEYAHKRFWQEAPKVIPNPQEPIRNTKIFRTIHNRFKDIVRLNGKLDKSYIKQMFSIEKLSVKSKDLLLYKNIFGLGFYSAVDYVKFPTDKINLYFAIVKKMQDELLAQYGVPLYIVLWDYDMHAQFLDKYDEVLKANFRKIKVPFYSLSEMIDDYPKDLERVKNGDFDNLKYRVSRWDTHPNALANQKIAEFLAQKIKNGEIKSHKITQKGQIK